MFASKNMIDVCCHRHLECFLTRTIHKHRITTVKDQSFTRPNSFWELLDSTTIFDKYKSIACIYTISWSIWRSLTANWGGFGSRCCDQHIHRYQWFPQSFTRFRLSYRFPIMEYIGFQYTLVRRWEFEVALPTPSGVWRLGCVELRYRHGKRMPRWTENKIASARSC